MSHEMTIKKDLKCIFNMPEQLNSQFDGSGEEYHSLPPYAPVDVYPVDEYESCPTNWMHGSDVASSYFIGVKEDHGMWLDFNECFYHTHDVAVVISIQGINPITGQKMVAEKTLQLEQYHKKCPIHNVKFQQDRYCKKCDFKWPGQNYLATTGTPEMMMWLDGFRTPGGKVRQYIFTEDKMKGVASQLIGKDRVFAIGIAYYLSKNKKPYTLQRPTEGSASSVDSGVPISAGSGVTITHPIFFNPLHNPGRWDNTKAGNWVKDAKVFMDSNDPMDDPIGASLHDADLGIDDGIVMNGAGADDSIEQQTSAKPWSCKKGSLKAGGQSMNSVPRVVPISANQSRPVVPVKNLEIGAGALIKQSIYDDPKMISYWETEPAGMIYINYCDEETKKKILDSGRRADEKDGFMKGIKVGG